MEKQIEELRAELEVLYIKMKAHEVSLEEVLGKSLKLDALLMECAAYHNGSPPENPQKP